MKHVKKECVLVFSKYDKYLLYLCIYIYIYIYIYISIMFFEKINKKL